MRIAAAVALLVAAVDAAWAGGKGILPTSVPTLEEGGLIALVAIVGVVAGLVARRRKK